jgi:hypothetical protein
LLAPDAGADFRFHHDALVGGRLIRPIHHLDKGVLHYVLGKLAIADAALQATQKRAVVFD